MFLSIKNASAQMKKQGTGGSIICTASVAGLRSGAGNMDYSASKAAVINMCQVAANELGGSGIRVNAVCPGVCLLRPLPPLSHRVRCRFSRDRNDKGAI